MEDGIGGLQIWDIPSSTWQDVKPVPGTSHLLHRLTSGSYVVNLGDMMSKWTREIYKTALHRVINMSGKDRYSVPFFFDGALDGIVDCLPGCEDGPGEKSDPVTVEGHMLRKFAETYGREPPS
jgi:isopenicillin N synthase-like dioxygenase